MVEAAPCRFDRFDLVQHEPIGYFQHHIKALQARETWSVWHRVGRQVRQTYGDALDGDARLHVGTEQIASEPVYELLVRTLRDAQQSVDATVLQFCLCARGEGAVLGFS